MYLKPADLGEIYKEPIQAEVYTLIVDDPDDYIGYHNHKKNVSPIFY